MSKVNKLTRDPKKRFDKIWESLQAAASPPQFDRVVSDYDKLKTSLAITVNAGYAFYPKAITKFARHAMEVEARRLAYEGRVYVARPIQEYGNTTVTQSHERAYFPIGNQQIPIATWASRALAHHTRRLDPGPIVNSDLSRWEPTEAGYQIYICPDGHISPHRDRRSDQLLGATITLDGSAVVRIHQPLDDPDDYTNLEKIDEFETKPGSLMLLRAPGFGNGQQVIHEVLPPKKGRRLVLNLRMRTDVLASPKEEKK